jgi:multidrug efflux pump
MSFTDIFIKRPVLAIVVSMLILLIGLRSMLTLPIRQYPELQNTVISVTTVYPGASPDLIQGFITTPLEQAVASADGIDYMTSSSIQGVSAISVYIKLNYDPSKALTDVMSKVNQVKYQIPKEANDPIINKQTGDTIDVMYIGFSSNDLGSAAITDYLTRVVQPLLTTVDGVASAEILGGQTFAMRLWLDPRRMAARGVSATDVATAIATNNYQSAPGQVKSFYTITNVSANTGLLDVEEFRQMVVKAKGGALIRMRDIAEVDLGPQSMTSSVQMSGERAVFIGLKVTPTGNPLTLVKGVRAMMPILEKSLPPTVKMKVAYDSTKFITASINEVISTLVEATIIVIVVIFLFLGTLRSVVIPVVTIPLSLIGVAIIMLAFGFSLNLLTLLALVLAIGLVVDDAIVVVENVQRHIEEGKSAVQASLIGAREIIGPIIAMTITLAAVYAPIGLLGGLTGSLFREFAFTLAGSVVVSGVIALTLSPMMCSVLLTREMSEGRFPKLVDRTFKAVTEWYGRRLDSSLDYRPVTALFAISILAAVPMLYQFSAKELAPDEDQGFLFSIIKGPQYANLDYMNHYSDQLDAAYASVPERDTTFILNGTSSISSGFGGILLTPWDQRTRKAAQISQDVQGKVGQIPGLKIFIASPPALPGGSGGLPVQMVINSPSGYEIVFKAMEEIKTKARQSGMFIVTDSDLQYNNPVINMRIDRSKANDLGLDMQSIGNTLALLVGENYVNRFNLNGRSYEVIPQAPRAERLNAEGLTQYYLTTRSGDQVPLSTVVKVDQSVQPNALTQFNQLNSATFSAVLMPGVTQGDAVAFLEKTANEVLPKDFNHDWLSDTRQFVQEGNQLAITFGFAVIIIFLVLAAQFESLRDPLVILVSVPMSIFGAMVPLFMHIATINIYTQIGLITLVGLITKHGILMVSFANEMQVSEGVDRRTAIEHAARTRLRPILMTTAAMVVGLVPLVTATGAGAASRFGIGLVIVAGMIIGTMFTLFVLPAVYTVLAKDHLAASKSLRNKEIAEVGARSRSASTTRRSSGASPWRSGFMA